MDMNYRGGMWEGGGWAGWSGVGGKWDNCNSIINKYIKKKKKKKKINKYWAFGGIFYLILYFLYSFSLLKARLLFYFTDE